MYFLALVFVFVLAIVTEWLSHSRLLNTRSSASGAILAQTLLHALRVDLAYLVMLTVMSFNGGVFLVTIAGHALGFVVFGSCFFRSGDIEKVAFDLPPMGCRVRYGSIYPRSIGLLNC
jgi:copper transporter 1